MTAPAASEAARRTRLWDLPTRLVHWSLVALIPLSWWSAEAGRMELHRYSGYAVMGVVLFRLYWGFAGASTARFAGFVKGPAATLAYLGTLGNRAPSETPGHNPLGGLSIMALLGVLVAHVTFGLFAVDIDGLESGPLSHLVEFDTGRAFAEWHETSFKILLVLIGLHLAAVAFYLVYKRENLIRPMVLGWRTFSGVQPHVRTAPAWRAVVGIAAAAVIAWFIAKGLRL